VSAARGRRFWRFLPLLMVLGTGCNWNLPGKPDPKKRPMPTDWEVGFSVLFSRNCAGCHGKDGRVGPAPPLNDDLFRASISEKELRDVIANGRNVTKTQKTMMPAFARKRGGILSPAQIDVLVYEIKGLRYKLVKKGHGVEPNYEVVKDPEGKQPAWGEPGPRPKDAPPYTVQPIKAALTSADYERIRTTTFKRACAECHGSDGQGAKMGKQKIGAIHDRAFLMLVSNQALRRIMITGRLDLAVEGEEAMPGYSPALGRNEPLTSEEIHDLVALLAYWRGGGQTGKR
jgi:mono/diheme cytochrome c family protein